MSNMTAGPGVSLGWMLWVAFSRWPIERCFELAKRNLGMDHFEIRSWRGIHRHLYISQLSLLFRSRVHKRLGTEKNAGDFVSDRRAGSSRRLRLGRRTIFTAAGAEDNIPTSRPPDYILSETESTSPREPHETNSSPSARTGHRSRSINLVYPG